jgi:hypothetical protein
MNKENRKRLFRMMNEVERCEEHIEQWIKKKQRATSELKEFKQELSRE